MNGLLRLIHLLSASLFLGNVVATLAWKYYAERTRSPLLIEFALRCALFADRLITGPCAAIVTLSGILLLVFGDKGQLQHVWLQVSMAIWAACAFIALFYLVPTLKRLHDQTVAQLSAEQLNQSYYSASARWNTVAIILIIGPIVIVLLAVMKPALT